MSEEIIEAEGLTKVLAAAIGIVFFWRCLSK